LIVNHETPLVENISPANGELGVAVGENITIIFNEAMDPTTINNANLTLSGGVTPLTSVVTYDGDTLTATIDPDATLDLDPSTLYTVTLGTGISDARTTPTFLPQVLSWTFTTAP
jgi:hypothetical protein